MAETPASDVGAAPHESAPTPAARGTGAGAGGGAGAGAGGVRKWRFGVLWNEDNAPEKDCEKRYEAAFGDAAADEPWRVWNTTAGEFPTREDIESYDGFVMSGSHYSAYEELPWIAQLFDFIRTAHSVASKRPAGARRPRLLGVCFGCQTAAHALGGRTAKNDGGVETLQVETLELTAVGAAKPYAKPLLEACARSDDGEGPSSVGLWVLEAHGDRVHELPEGSKVIATSPTAPLEVWELDDCVLGIQGHPEFDLDIMTKILARRKASNSWNDEQSDAAWVAVSAVPASNSQLRAAMRLFITGGLESPPTEPVVLPEAAS